MTHETREINRRTVVKGAAWATPVVLATAAAPALAASPVPPYGGNYFLQAYSGVGSVGDLYVNFKMNNSTPCTTTTVVTYMRTRITYNGCPTTSRIRSGSLASSWFTNLVLGPIVNNNGTCYQDITYQLPAGSKIGQCGGSDLEPDLNFGILSTSDTRQFFTISTCFISGDPVMANFGQLGGSCFSNNQSYIDPQTGTRGCNTNRSLPPYSLCGSSWTYL